MDFALTQPNKGSYKQTNQRMSRHSKDWAKEKGNKNQQNPPQSRGQMYKKSIPRESHRSEKDEPLESLVNFRYSYSHQDTGFQPQRRPKFKKASYVHANFHFVLGSMPRFSKIEHVDKYIEWKQIEEVRLSTPVAIQCEYLFLILSHQILSCQ
jgi:hypothetical protein